MAYSNCYGRTDVDIHIKRVLVEGDIGDREKTETLQSESHKYNLRLNEAIKMLSDEIINKWFGIYYY